MYPFLSRKSSQKPQNSMFAYAKYKATCILYLSQCESDSSNSKENEKEVAFFKNLHIETMLTHKDPIQEG